jgi:hypothetical protein
MSQHNNILKVENSRADNNASKLFRNGCCSACDSQNSANEGGGGQEMLHWKVIVSLIGK